MSRTAAVDLGRTDSKWTSFLLSLVVPGTGQLYAGSVWCLPWFAAAATICALPPIITGTTWLQPILGLLCGVASAEHA